MTYEFEVPGKITGKGRPRVNSYTGIVYTTNKNKRLRNFSRTIFFIKIPTF